MAYLSTQDVVVKKSVCNHPKVIKCWEHGALAWMPTSSELKRHICLLLDDGTVKDFEDDGNGFAVIEAENFLESLK